jgi:hypothetical protein
MKDNMRSRFVRGLMSPSMIVALFALFVALGGTAWASQARTQQVLGAKIQTVVKLSRLVQPGASAAAVAMCPSGYTAIGGGAQPIHDYVNDDAWEQLQAGPHLVERTAV